MNIVGVYIIIILFCALLFAVGAILLDGITTFLKPTDGVKESGLCKEYESGLSGLRYIVCGDDRRRTVCFIKTNPGIGPDIISCV